MQRAHSAAVMMIAPFVSRAIAAFVLLGAGLAAPASAERFPLKVNPVEILGEAAQDHAAPGYRLETPIDFFVEAYPSPDGDPPGVFVYISPTPDCRPPPGWAQVLEARNLVWICPLNAGNNAPPPRRILAALTAAAALSEKRELDPDRTYLGGLSGGARIASRAIGRAPDEFEGAMYFVGASSWETSDPDQIAKIIDRRFVFFTGHADFTRELVLRVAAEYKAAGAQQMQLLDLPGVGHELPNAQGLDRILAYLDERPQAD